jgi:hypothetical protein
MDWELAVVLIATSYMHMVLDKSNWFCPFHKNRSIFVFPQPGSVFHTFTCVLTSCQDMGIFFAQPLNWFCTKLFHTLTGVKNNANLSLSASMRNIDTQNTHIRVFILLVGLPMCLLFLGHQLFLLLLALWSRRASHCGLLWEGKKTEELCSELLGMASTQLEEAVRPLRDALGSLHGLMLQFGSFLERAEAALGRLSLSLTALHIIPDVGFAEDNGEDLYGSLSPCVEVSSTAMAPVV